MLCIEQVIEPRTIAYCKYVEFSIKGNIPLMVESVISTFLV